MKKLVLFVAALLAVGATSVGSASAQTYQKAVGLNLGFPLGINYKQFVSNSGAVEATLGYVNQGVMLTALYEHHINLVENFYMYVGGGLNIGAVDLHKEGQFALGISPVVGFEYKFNGAPVALAVDYAPEINFLSPMNFSTAAFKIRFAF